MVIREKSGFGEVQFRPHGLSGKRTELLGSSKQSRSFQCPSPGWLRRSLSCTSNAGGCERAAPTLVVTPQWDGCGRLESALESCFGGRPSFSAHPAFHGPSGVSGSPEGRAALLWTA